MDGCRRCLRSYPSHWSLKTIGQICGLFGVMLRLILIILTIIEIAEIPHDPRGIGTMVVLTLLAYGLFTLGTNITFVYGVMKEKPILLLPHIVIEAFEIILLIIYTVVGSSFVNTIHYGYDFKRYLSINILLLGFALGFFLCSILLFRKMHRMYTNV
ncbi:hypothetical protein JTB14_029288 [Gonioctena quinquepunctata]|nr:hypothetical protein JTB14_029288 [Gonioctena quinquepunctata]